MRTLTKADVAKTICDQTDMRQMDAKRLLDVMLGLMKNALKEEHEVLLSGFGKFEVFTKKERKGRNPHTDMSITLDAHEVLAFRLSRKFKAELNYDKSGTDDKPAAHTVSSVKIGLRERERERERTGAA